MDGATGGRAAGAAALAVPDHHWNQASPISPALQSASSISSPTSPPWSPTKSILRNASTGTGNSPSGASTSSVFPYLRKLDIRASDMLARHAPTPKKPPMLTLTVPGTSFLDALVLDERTSAPLYAVATAGTTTSVSRADADGGRTRIAELRWTKSSLSKSKQRGSLEGAVVQINGGRWKSVESFLKPGNLVSSRKFNIPGYTRSLKWKRMGDTYYCTTSGVKTAIATFDPTLGPTPAVIRVFETFHDRNKANKPLEHAGVSLVLLDYVLLTSLLLSTDTDEWISIARTRSTSVPPSAALSPDEIALSPGNIQSRQWRKIAYGEPLYQGRVPSPGASDAGGGGSCESLVDVSVEDSRVEFDQAGPEGEAATEGGSSGFDGTSARFSLSSEATYFPPTPGSSSSCPPAHDYFDPSYYGGRRREDVPPVPELPIQYLAQSSIPLRSSSLPTASNSLSFQQQQQSRRERPLPPSPIRSPAGDLPPPELPWIPRSRSTPPVPPSPTHPAYSTTSFSSSPSNSYSHSPMSSSGAEDFGFPPTPELHPVSRSHTLNTPSPTQGMHESTVSLSISRRSSIVASPLRRRLPQPPTPHSAQFPQTPVHTASLPLPIPPTPTLPPPPTPTSFPSSPAPTPPSSASNPAPIRSTQEKRMSGLFSRTLPLAPTAASSSAPAQPQPHRQSQHPALKDADELATLVQHMNMSPMRASVFDAPPPAYNQIDFSLPRTHPPAAASAADLNADMGGYTPQQEAPEDNITAHARRESQSVFPAPRLSQEVPSGPS